VLKICALLNDSSEKVRIAVTLCLASKLLILRSCLDETRKSWGFFIYFKMIENNYFETVINMLEE
jgi:hypothetical protein